MIEVVLASTVWKVVDWLRQLRARDASAVVTQALAWVAGIILTWVATTADAFTKVVLPGTSQPLGDYNGASIALIGILLSSFASSLVDVKQAIDGSDSATKPPLIPLHA